MDTSQIEARAELIIRKSVSDVYRSFIYPALTTRFWFSKSSGQLTPNADVQWDWAAQPSAIVHVKAIEENHHIIIEWHDTETLVVRFQSLENNQTLVTMRDWVFSGSEKEVVERSLATTNEFALVLAGLKVYLEHGLQLNLLANQAQNPS